MGRLIGVTLLFVAAASAQQYATYAGTPVSRQSYLRSQYLAGSSGNINRDSRLVAYWPLAEGGKKPTTRDFSGNANSGTWVGTAAGTNGYYSAGPSDLAPWAGNFDGSTNAVNCSDSGFPSGASARSVSVWVYVDSYVSFQTIFNYGTGGTTAKGWNIGLTAAHKLGVFGYGDNTGAVGSTTVPLATWTMLTVTYDGTNVQYYFNGLKDSASTTFSTPLNTTLVSCRIGRSVNNWDSPSGTYLFPGRIADLRLYNVALSANEVWQIYLAGTRASGCPVYAIAGQNPYNTSTTPYAFASNDCGATFAATSIVYAPSHFGNPAMIDLLDGRRVMLHENFVANAMSVAVSVGGVGSVLGVNYTNVATIGGTNAGCGSVGCRLGGMGAFYWVPGDPHDWQHMHIMMFSDDGTVAHGVKNWELHPMTSDLQLPWSTPTQVTGTAITAIDPLATCFVTVGATNYALTKNENVTQSMAVLTNTTSYLGPYNTTGTDYSTQFGVPAEECSLVSIGGGVQRVFHIGTGMAFPTLYVDWTPGSTPGSRNNVQLPGITGGFWGVTRIAAGSLR